jgi:CubicO group peptidase (beta-lactamase class C family)
MRAAALALLAICLANIGARADPVVFKQALNGAAIDEVIAREMEVQKIPGLALGIVYKGNLLYAKGYGKANIENEVPATPDSVFAIASVSKPIIALGVARLVEQGKLRFDDPIAKYLPGTPKSWKDVRLTHLLSHTSGITRESPAFDGERIKPDFELVAAAFSVPLVSPTGTKWEYCNVCYFALAEVITRVGGDPWPQFMQKEMFQRAGMKDTRTTSVRDIIPRRAASYEWRHGRHENIREYIALRPSGAFVSTVNDLARLEAELWDGRVVSAETLRLMETPARLNDGSTARGSEYSVGYGMGWDVAIVDGRRRVAHDGALAGFRTVYARYPDQGWAVIVLANSSSGCCNALEGTVAKLLPSP